MAKSKGRQKSKAAQHTHATRADRQREKELQRIEDHPEAVAFESRSTVDDALYRRQLDGPSDAEAAKMKRNLLWLGLACALPGAWFIYRVM